METVTVFVNLFSSWLMVIEITACMHKSINSTQVYVQLLQGHNKEEYVCEAATTLEEAQTLIETGFEYVTSMLIGQTTYKMFRKKKPWRPN